MKCIIFICSFFLLSFTANAQSLNAFILQYHGAGCDNQSGKLAVVATGGTGTYSYLWSSGSTIDTAYNLGTGMHSVTVYSGTDSIIKTTELLPWGIDTIYIGTACNGGTGSIFLDNINAQYPIQYNWFDTNGLMTQHTASISNLSAGSYQYQIIDADGCIDSGNVNILASNPQLSVQVSDSVLCYGESAQMWYTPGFTLYDNWGVTYNSTTDTLVAQNYMNMINYPTYGVDSLGCEANLLNNPFVYLQPHPDPVPLYQIGDTISATFIINLNPNPNLVYTWYMNSVEVSSGAFSYLPIDTTSYYSVSILNEYGCTNFGSIQATVTGNTDNTSVDRKIIIKNNPTSDHQAWQIDIENIKGNLGYSLYDTSGKVIIQAETNSNKLVIPAPQNTGIYYLEIDGNYYKLLKR